MNQNHYPRQTRHREKIIPLVTHFSSLSTQLYQAIKSNFVQFLTPTKYFQHHKPIAAYRRNKNILDTLVKLRAPLPKGRVGKCRYFTPLRWVRNRFRFLNCLVLFVPIVCISSTVSNAVSSTGVKLRMSCASGPTNMHITLHIKLKNVGTWCSTS